MPRPPRIKYELAYYHVFNRGVNKMPIFFDDFDRQLFLKICRQVTVEMHVRVFAFCLMHNHYHFFIQTKSANVDKFMQKLQSRYAQFANFRHGRVGALFQGRYQSRVVDVDSYALTLTRYIHMNPVTSGYVKTPGDYPWSSYDDYLENKRTSWISTHLILDLLGGKNKVSHKQFEEFHQAVPQGSDPSDPTRL